jgi:hypothetical protein
MCRRERVIADYRKWPHAQHYRFLTERLGFLTDSSPTPKRPSRAAGERS